MFYEHVHLQLSCGGFQKCKEFGMIALSSNNPQYFKTRKGYVICKNESGNYLTSANVSFRKFLRHKKILEWNR